jgi:hypothetical protein
VDADRREPMTGLRATLRGVPCSWELLMGDSGFPAHGNYPWELMGTEREPMGTTHGNSWESPRREFPVPTPHTVGVGVMGTRWFPVSPPPVGPPATAGGTRRGATTSSGRAGQAAEAMQCSPISLWSMDHTPHGPEMPRGSGSARGSACPPSAYRFTAIRGHVTGRAGHQMGARPSAPRGLVACGDTSMKGRRWSST